MSTSSPHYSGSPTMATNTSDGYRSARTPFKIICRANTYLSWALASIVAPFCSLFLSSRLMSWGAALSTLGVTFGRGTMGNRSMGGSPGGGPGGRRIPISLGGRPGGGPGGRLGGLPGGGPGGRVGRPGGGPGGRRIPSGGGLNISGGGIPIGGAESKGNKDGMNTKMKGWIWREETLSIKVHCFQRTSVSIFTFRTKILT